MAEQKRRFSAPQGIDAGNKTITGLAAPSATTDAATKSYVDTAVSGVSVTQIPVTDTTTTNSTHYLTFTTGISGNQIFRVASTKLTFNPSTGTLTASGDIASSSDERLKADWSNLPPNTVEMLAQVKAGVYTRLDTGYRQLGVSAQDMQKISPNSVSEGEDGYLSLNYGHSALAMCVELAKRLVTLEEELVEIKKLHGVA